MRGGHHSCCQTLAVLLALSPVAGGRAQETLSNAWAALHFSSAAGGLDCQAITEGGGGRYLFPAAGGPAPGLWRLTFLRLADDGTVATNTLLNRSPAAAVQFAHLPESNGVRRVRLSWRGLSLPDEPGVVDVAAEVELWPEGESRWYITVDNRSVTQGLWSVEYPYLATVCTAGTAAVIFPGGLLGGALKTNCAVSGLFHYPSATMSMPFTAFLRDGRGLYAAAHDPAGWIKRLRITTAQDLTFEHYPAEMATPGAGFASAYPVVVAPFTGDWWTAAKRYRAWTTTSRTPALLPLARRNLPTNAVHHGVTLQVWQGPLSVATWVKQARDRFGIPIQAFWCEWGVWPFDHNLPDLFPARSNMPLAVGTMREQGSSPMPYMNARIWCSDHADFQSPAVLDGRVRDVLGNSVFEGSNVVMCPSAAVARGAWSNVCARLFSECGVDVVYLDQVMAARAYPCFASAHAHPRGGAGAWSAAYRTLLADIRASGTAAGRPFALVSEVFCDAWPGELDAGLPCWWDSALFADAIPLNQAVYSGYQYWAPNADNAALQTLAGYVGYQGRYFLWGLPFSAHMREFQGVPWACDDLPAAHAFLAAAAPVRFAAREFMIHGELLGELAPTSPRPQQGVVWKILRGAITNSVTMTDAVVRASLWRAPSGDLGVALVNFAATPQSFPYRIDPAAWRVADAKGGTWRLSELGTGGEVVRSFAPANDLSGNESLPPYSVRFLAWRPAGRVALFTWQGTNELVRNYTGIAENTLYWGWGSVDPASVCWWNMGRYASLRFGEADSSGGRTRGLLRFDLAALRGLGLTIREATLILGQNGLSTNFMGNTNWNTFTFSLYQIADANAGWAEGTNIQTAATAGESCWARRAAMGSNWVGAAGLDIAGVDYHTPAVAAGVVFQPGNRYAQVRIPLPASLINTWIDGTNAGLLLRTDPATPPGVVAIYCTKEVNWLPQNRPALELVYSWPQGSLMLVR